jgi:hypothetical protein
MDTRICTFVNTTELDAIIQKIIKELNLKGDRKGNQIISVVRTSEFKQSKANLTIGDCADYIILYK